MRPATIAKVRIVSASSKSPFAQNGAERAHRRAAPDRLEPLDVLHRRELRRAGDRASRERRIEDLGEADTGAQAPFDGRDEMRDAGELVLRHQLRPAHRSGLADAREIVALEVDDHHVLGRVLRVVDVLAERTRALDRHRPDAIGLAREEELGRRGDDRPAVAFERRGVQRAERGCQPRRVALERRREVLHEVHLVDVAAPDRLTHLFDRGGVLLVASRCAATRRRVHEGAGDRDGV